MAISRREQLLLAGLAVVAIAGGGYWYWSGPVTSASQPSSSNRQAAAGAAGGARTQQAPQTAVPDVHLDALDAERPKPDGGERDLFRFKPKAPPPPPPSAAVRRPTEPGGTAPPVPTGPPPPPPLAPIPLKFIGIMGPANEKIAVLSDGRGTMTGKEGDLVLGQYRILKIGVESVDVAYADGRGRQTIRLSGQ